MSVVLERETNEFRAVTVRDAAKAVYGGTWHYQITAYGQRPTGAWVASVSHLGKSGFSVQGLARGVYALWVRVDDDSPYAPVPKPVLFSVE